MRDVESSIARAQWHTFAAAVAGLALSLAACASETDRNTAPPAQPAACPVTRPTSGDSCSEVVAGCHYLDTTRCECFECLSYAAPCSDHAGREWVCAKPATGCPDPPPAYDAPCAMEGLRCLYGPAPCHGRETVCNGGAWKEIVQVCPL